MQIHARSPRTKLLAGIVIVNVLLLSLLPFASVSATVPGAPSTPDLSAASDTGNSNTDNITQTLNGLVFTGTAEIGSTVHIYRAGSTEIGSAVASAGGAYSVTTSVALLDNTASSITARAENGDGLGSASGALIVTTDNVAPGAPARPTSMPRAISGRRTPTT